MDVRRESIGIIGLGNMGSGIAGNLISAGFDVCCFDRRNEAMEPFHRSGASLAQDIDTILEKCGVVITCVLGRQSQPLYHDGLIPRCRRNQIFIDHATIPVPAARRIGEELRQKGARYLDAPISGGRGGAAAGTLRVFVGGDPDVAGECRPIFNAIGDPDKYIYCGTTGNGQAVKVVQQLTDRLPDLARLEVLHFGVQSGLDVGLIRKALGIDHDTANRYSSMCDALESGKISEQSFEYSEWEFYLEQAEVEGFHLPIVEAYYALAKGGELTTIDGAGRNEPSVWNELTAKSNKKNRS